jgi:hypothetical protein
MHPCQNIRLPLKRFCLLIWIGALFACSSVQVGYNQIDFLLKWWMDDYADLTSIQGHFLEQRLPLVHKKHRQEELPKVIPKLQTLRLKLDQPLKNEEGIKLVKDIKSFARDSANLLVDDLSNLALMLEPKQISYLEKALQKANKKYQADFMSGSADERFDKRVEKIIERTESICGNLDKSQQVKIREIAKEYLINMEETYEVRIYKQQLLLKTLKKINQDKPSHTLVKNMLTQLFNEIEAGDTLERKAFENKRDESAGIIIAKISEILNEPQRNKAQSSIRKWENDVQVLVKTKTQE